MRLGYRDFKLLLHFQLEDLLILLQSQKLLFVPLEETLYHRVDYLLDGWTIHLTTILLLINHNLFITDI